MTNTQVRDAQAQEWLLETGPAKLWPGRVLHTERVSVPQCVWRSPKPQHDSI